MSNLLPYPKRLRTIRDVNKVTSPRIGSTPSRHHELGTKNTSVAVIIINFTRTLVYEEVEKDDS